jgi:hypothetical protein
MDPIIRQIRDASGQLLWLVEGRGMCFTHRQQWQAEVFLHYLQTSVGASTAIGPPLALPSSGVASETN